jgi:hypothetical protein
MKPDYNTPSSGKNTGPARKESSLNSLVQENTPRDLVKTILNSAFTAKEHRFAEQVCLAWLTAYPGDLEIRVRHAQALLELNTKKQPRLRQALGILENISMLDPEYLEALVTLREARQEAGMAEDAALEANIAVLGGSTRKDFSRHPWVLPLKQARHMLASPGSVEREAVERSVHNLLASEPGTPLAGILHLQMAAQHELPRAATASLAEMYHNRWPECLRFTLVLADLLMDGGDSDRAVALLHQASAQDVSGQAPWRLWGEKHPYRGLWPEQLSAPILRNLAVPAGVAAVLGWNRLPSEAQRYAPFSATTFTASPAAGSGAASPAQAKSTPGMRSSSPRKTVMAKMPAVAVENPQIPDELRGVQDEFEKVAQRIKKPQLAHADGRYPVYVVFSTRYGLQKQYGAEGAAQVEAAMGELAGAVRGKMYWNSLFYLADDPLGSDKAAARLNLKPARPTDPWSLKLALTDLDAALRKQGEMIGALLIVGGPEVVPFHHLPNPVDDDDPDVPSDNPYASRDENYFIPEWPVGRLPGGVGREPFLLVKSLKRYAEKHRQAVQPLPPFSRMWQWAVERVRVRLGRSKPGMAYTAAIWKRASANVFRPIGEPAYMMVSPPVQIELSANGHNGSDPGLGQSEASRNGNGAKENGHLSLPQARLGYFNLHGLQDAAEWYGHRDPFEPASGPDYPVALRPVDVISGMKNRRAMEIVFTEACYGAHLSGRCVDESIALTFLNSGGYALAGSTCTAYGAVNLPLTAADMLGYAFWNGITAGLPVGEALRRGKLRLAREMHRRQGYLDGEDQKTLISFVLYGDPLFQPVGTESRAKIVLRSAKPPANVKLVCDLGEPEAAGEQVQPEIVDYVKNIVRDYLPGMEDAQLSLSLEHVGCGENGHTCPTAQIGAKSAPAAAPRRKVITLRKQVQQAKSVHRRYARITLDDKGKLVKLVVSR